MNRLFKTAPRKHSRKFLNVSRYSYCTGKKLSTKLSMKQPSLAIPTFPNYNIVIIWTVCCVHPTYPL